MTSLIINGTKVKHPDSWDEVSCETWLRIIKEWEPEKEIKDRSEVKLFSILNGSDYQAVYQSTDYYVEGQIYALTSFVYTDDFTKKPVPNALRIGERTIEIPKDVGRLSIGQNNHVRKLLRQADEFGQPIEPNLVIPMVTAIYLQPFYYAYARNGQLVNAEFDYYKAVDLEKKILKMPITQIYPIGFFLLNRLSNSGKPFPKLLNRTKQKIMLAAWPLQSWLNRPNLTHILRSLL